jgi:hypothetical protein
MHDIRLLTLASVRFVTDECVLRHRKARSTRYRNTGLVKLSTFSIEIGEHGLKHRKARSTRSRIASKLMATIDIAKLLALAKGQLVKVTVGLSHNVTSDIFIPMDRSILLPHTHDLV